MLLQGKRAISFTKKCLLLAGSQGRKLNLNHASFPFFTFHLALLPKFDCDLGYKMDTSPSFEGDFFEHFIDDTFTTNPFVRSTFESSPTSKSSLGYITSSLTPGAHVI